MSQPYYRNAIGLRFECTQCGDCCTRPGLVYFPAADLIRASQHLGMRPSQFMRRFRLRLESGIPALDPGTGPCSFYREDVGCTIYEARPVQCRTWPFWPEVVSRKRSWEKAARECEGIHRGPRIPVREIEKSVALCTEAGLPEADPW